MKADYYAISVDLLAFNKQYGDVRMKDFPCHTESKFICEDDHSAKPLVHVDDDEISRFFSHLTKYSKNSLIEESAMMTVKFEFLLSLKFFCRFNLSRFHCIQI